MPAVAASQKLTGEVTAPKNTTTKSSSSSLYTFPRCKCKASGGRRNRPLAGSVRTKNARLLNQRRCPRSSATASGVCLSGD